MTSNTWKTTVEATVRNAYFEYLKGVEYDAESEAHAANAAYEAGLNELYQFGDDNLDCNNPEVKNVIEETIAESKAELLKTEEKTMEKSNEWKPTHIALYCFDEVPFAIFTMKTITENGETVYRTKKECAEGKKEGFDFSENEDGKLLVDGKIDKHYYLEAIE